MVAILTARKLEEFQHLLPPPGDADPADTSSDPPPEMIYDEIVDPGRPTDAEAILAPTTSRIKNRVHWRTTGRSCVITAKHDHRGWEITDCLYEALPLEVPYGNKKPGEMAVLWGERTYLLHEATWTRCIWRGALIEHHAYHQGADKLHWDACIFEGAQSQAIQIFRSNPAWQAPPPPAEFVDARQRVTNCQILECGREGPGSRAAFALTFGNDVHGVRVLDTFVECVQNQPWWYNGRWFHSKGAFLAESRPEAQLGHVVINYKQPDRTLVYFNRVAEVSVDACRIYGGIITVRDCPRVEIRRCRGDGVIVVQHTNSSGQVYTDDVIPIRSGFIR